ncbi:hydantoinase/oxoprolinase N-terminal domain-containing protein [Streptomyces coffeae]|uniref:Hydantoinase/oxoprolinase family protein n=1 Tax=Streptomyces coffeae TaxID=621382 RepID=A0ABS1NNF9_9ACTN|nr:hydantoinase/oxoprolinase family protein [Streptomyces coffeae]MBL1101490.1 hydantoinase/oxoprolinase family protein [Streptomyces coffeae]
MHIGIDVGGTNTDAVLMSGSQVLAAVKTSTTDDITSGIVSALEELQRKRGFEPADVRAVMIGTTHFINALVEARRLAPTAALRLGLPATTSLPPMTDWPDRLVQAIRGRHYLCHGGHEFDGRHIAELDEHEVRRAAADMAEHGVRSVAISSVFSPVNAEFEERAAELLQAELPGIAVSLSHEIGRIGLLERENATIINASLRELATHIVDGLARSVAKAGIQAPLYLSQNDGTLMDVDFARRYPVATFASGPTNSMRGAALLSGLETCAVVDIGGTTSDIGILQRGFPREATTEVSVADIRTNFRMPDVLSIGIGGGSKVRREPQEVTIGPDSVGSALTQRALVFGGDTLTATDIAVAAGRANVGDASLVAHLDKELIHAALTRIAADVADLVERMHTTAAPLPLVAVGGGSILLPEQIAGCDGVHRPDHYAVANAVGAAIAQVGGEVDRVFPTPPGQRESVLDAAKQEAVERAVAAGATPGSVSVVECEEVPLPYLPGNAARIRVRAVGDLSLED